MKGHTKIYGDIFLIFLNFDMKEVINHFKCFEDLLNVSSESGDGKTVQLNSSEIIIHVSKVVKIKQLRTLMVLQVFYLSYYKW